MTVKGPRVRDFTDSERQLPVVVDASPAYELVLTLFAFGCEDCGDYEVGQDWFDRRYEESGGDLRGALDLIRATGERLVNLLGLIYELGDKSIDGFLDRLAALDPEELLLTLLVHDISKGGIAEATVRAAANGEPDAIEALLAAAAHPHSGRGLQAIFAREAAAFQADLVAAVKRFAAEFLGGIDDVVPVLERDAAEKRAMAATMLPERLVEEATNGVTFAMRPDVSGVVLIPSVIVRPFVVIAEHGKLRMFAYPVADESMSADADTPPAALVGLYKALGDERRLRILGILAEGDAGLMDITERLGLAKSTVHHHLMILRRAGLIRVTVGEERDYSLRTDSIPQAAHLLEAFLEARAARDEERP